MTPRARIACAGAVGALAATVVFAWVVFGGRADPLAPETLGGIYDAQARSLLDGHWDMPPQELLFERFTVDGRYYTYFGPWPALLRMPIVAFTDEYFGQLSRVSMVLAFAVLLTFTTSLAWQARKIVRGDGPVGWRSLAATGGFVFVVGCGSTALFLGSRALANHEAILWGIAWSVASLSGIVAYLQHGRTWLLVWACVAATLAISSRASVGLGPVFALGLLLAVRVVQHASDWWSRGRRDADEEKPRWLGRWLGVDRDTARGSIWRTALAVAAPVAAYGYVNYSKFGTLFSVPIEKQDFQLQRPERREVLAATGNSLFGIDYVPTNLLQYLRPDAIGFRQTFPWVTFSDRPHVFGGVTFDDIEPSASVTITSILLVGLAVLGTVAAIRGVRARGVGDRVEVPAARPRAPVTAAVFRVPLVAAALATASTFAIADLYQRYQGDLLPFIVVGSALGLCWLPVLLGDRASWVRRSVGVVLVVLAAWSCWAVFGLTLIYQREYGGLQPLALRPGFVSFQLDVNDALGLDLPNVRRGRTLPVRKGDDLGRTDAPHGQLFVIGDCRGLFIATGRNWEAIETRPSGQRRYQVRFGPPTPGVRQPLWSSGADPSQVLWAEWVDDSHVRFVYEARTPEGVFTGKRVLEVEPGRTYDLDVRLDPNESYIEVAHDGKLLFERFHGSFDRERASAIGRQPNPALGATEFAGSIRPVSLTPICDRLTQ